MVIVCLFCLACFPFVVVAYKKVIFMCTNHSGESAAVQAQKNNNYFSGTRLFYDYSEKEETI